MPGTVLITGASSGIGAALAQKFAQHGHPVVLVARNEQRLQLVAEALRHDFGVEAAVLVQDLSMPNACAALVEQLTQQQLTVDILVNNAGLGDIRPFTEEMPDDLARMLQVNVSALTQLTSLLLPSMLARGFGRVLNVASVAAFQPVPVMGAYAASKAYVLSLTESLAEELAGTGVTATALCPGLTNTEMAQDFERLAGDVTPLLTLLMGEADDVAEAGFEACMAGTTVCVPGAVNRAASAWSQVQPRWLVRKLGGLVAREFSRR